MTFSTAGTDLASQKARIGGYAIDPAVLGGIRKAARATGVDFGYLMAQAAQESGFDARASASGSSAKGLYQFVDATWLRMVRDHGDAHGLGHFADAIKSNGSVDPVLRRQILALRNDPQVSAALGAEFARENKQDLEDTLGRKVGPTELYLAHFLGSGGASRFLQVVQRNSAARAADLLPQAAASNPSVFFDRASGRARTVGEIYAMFDRSITQKSTAFAELADGAPTGWTGDHTGSFAPRSTSAGLGSPTNIGAASDDLPLSLTTWTLLQLAALAAPGERDDEALSTEPDQTQRKPVAPGSLAALADGAGEARLRTEAAYRAYRG